MEPQITINLNSSSQMSGCGLTRLADKMEVLKGRNNLPFLPLERPNSFPSLAKGGGAKFRGFSYLFILQCSYMKTTKPPIVVKQSFHVRKEKVWSALTEVEEMRQWFFPNIPEYRAKVGFETKFIVVSGKHSFPHVWKVLEIIPEQKMVQQWSYEGYSGLCTVALELEEISSGTTLTVTATVLQDFPDDIPEFKRESGVAGWEYFIQQQLKHYLED